MSDEERDELTFAITLVSKYSEQYLRTLSDDELLNIYTRVMGQSD